MKREVEREESLGAFRIDLASLELLVTRLRNHFAKPEFVRLSIDITLPGEKLEFESVDELRAYENLPNSISKMRIWLSGGGHRIVIRVGSSFFDQAKVSAQAESGAWCAGALAVATEALRAHQRWYSSFRAWPFGVLMFGSLVVSMLLVNAIEKGKPETGFPALAALLACVVFGLLFLSRGALFPSGTLQIRTTESFLRRYAAELGLLLASLSLVIAVISLLSGK